MSKPDSKGSIEMNVAAHATTLDFDADNLVEVYSNAALSNQHREDVALDIRARLNAVLQSTLDIESLLGLFLEEIQVAVKVEGIVYQNLGKHIQLEIGESSVHTTSYRIITDSDMLGALSFRRQKPFSKHECRRLEGLVGSLIYPLRNALRYHDAVKQALTDTLTGVGNRLAIENDLGREMHTSRRYEMPLSVIMVDIDHFKKVNDQYGHLAGDEVLKGISGAIRDTMRSSDSIFRYGGEEFLVLLNKTDLNGAYVIAERLRIMIENLSCIVDQQPIPVTVSMGVTEVQNDDSQASLFQRADTLLYEAKANGRNQVVARAVKDKTMKVVENTTSKKND